MSDWTYVAVGYVAVFVVLVVYAARLVARGKSLSKQVPPEDRRWM